MGAATTAAADEEVVHRGVEDYGRRAGESDVIAHLGEPATKAQGSPADGQRTRTERGIVIDADRACRDRGAAGKSVRARERERARAGLRERPGPADDSGVMRVTRLGDVKGSAVRDGDGTGAGETGGGYDDVACAGRDGSVERDASARGERQRTSQRGRGVDDDVVIGDEREAVGAQRRDGRGDRDIPGAGRIGRRDARGRTRAGGADGDIAREQAVAQLVGSEVAAAGRDGDVDGVEQPVAGAALGRPGVDGDARDLKPVAGGLDPSAVAAEFAAARADDPDGLRQRKDVADVRPEHDFAAASEPDRRGVDERGRGLGDATRLRERTGALPATADMDATAAELAGGEQGRGVE